MLKMDLARDSKWEVLEWSSKEGPCGRSCTAECLDETGALWFHFGGLGERRHNDLWCLNLVERRWECLHPGTGSGDSSSDCPPKRCKASLSKFKDLLIVFGGWAGGKGDAGKLNDLWVFHLPSRTWRFQPTNGQTPSARSSHATRVVDNVLYLFGGIGANKFGDMYRLQLDTWTWGTMTGVNSGPPRSSFGSLLHLVGSSPVAEDTDGPTKSSLLLFGGLTCGQLNDVLCLPLAAARSAPGSAVTTGGKGAAAKSAWTEIRPRNAKAAPFKRGRHSTCLLENQYLVVFGGTNLRQRDNTLFFFDLKQQKWHHLEKKAPSLTWPPTMEGQSMAITPTGELAVLSGWEKSGWQPKLFFLPKVGEIVRSLTATADSSGSGIGEDTEPQARTTPPPQPEAEEAAPNDSDDESIA